MNDRNNPKLKGYAQTLRREMTREERHLWYDLLKQLPLTVNRQKVIGPYIADFYCAKAKLVLELDGSGHYEDEQVLKDCIRTNAFKEMDIEVLRFSNLDVVRNFEGVCVSIDETVKQRINLNK